MVKLALLHSSRTVLEELQQMVMASDKVLGPLAVVTEMDMVLPTLPMVTDAITCTGWKKAMVVAVVMVTMDLF